MGNYCLIKLDWNNGHIMNTIYFVSDTYKCSNMLINQIDEIILYLNARVGKGRREDNFEGRRYFLFAAHCQRSCEPLCLSGDPNQRPL